MSISRRDCLMGFSALVAGGAVTSLVDGGSHLVQAAPAKRFEQVNGEFGWTPHKLDPAECAQAAYEGYWYKGYACGYGVFYGLVGVLGEKYGAPYNQFPFSMLEANKGGISDWGTICGALYGAAAAYALFWGRDDRTPMVHELYRWYEKTALPIYDPKDKAQGVPGAIPSNVSGSVLCHISVSKWCYENKIEATAKARNERCGRLTADVAMKAAEIFNQKIELGKDFKTTMPVQDSVKYCKTCHQTKGEETNWAKGVMDCTPCHSGSEATGNMFKDHP